MPPELPEADDATRRDPPSRVPPSSDSPSTGPPSSFVDAPIWPPIDRPTRADRAAHRASTPGPRSPLDRALDWFAEVTPEAWITLGIVASCVVFAFVQLQPELIFRDTTPNGGDMGAHVWAPAYLRDHLLPNWQLTGWTPDWYAGFPVLRFYMVPPMLAIVALDLVAPYGVAFKIVSVVGVLTLPVAAWAFGRLAGLRFPAPALFALGALLFLFERDFSIYGGNIPSTLAGEFSFSIGLSLAVLYLGLVANGLRTGRYRAWTAVVVGLCGLTHVIPLIFAVVGTLVLFLVRPSRRGALWLATSAPVGALLAAWWLLPFWWQRAHLNDMGWGKLLPPADAHRWEQVGFWITKVFPNEHRWTVDVPGLGPDVRLDILLVLIGAVGVIAAREPLGRFFVVMLVVGAAAVVLLPQGRLWNARLLPFTHLIVYFVLAMGLATLIRQLAGIAAPSWREPLRVVGALAALGVGLFLVALPLRVLPVFGELRDDGTYTWLFVESTDSSFIPGWARWNYRGYEGKGENWEEHRDVIATMERLGEENGCGRAMWEYSKELDRYGTPMALMLLPHWTDGCIGSMEGLYFESSTTTPFHFLNQSALSEAGSRAQRDLPYGGFDINLGIGQLQKMGVRYYMAESTIAIDAAAGHPHLTEVARSGPWVIYEVGGAPLVEPLLNEPVVLAEPPHDNEGWLEEVAPWFQDPTRWDVHIAADGPDEWERVDDLEDLDPTPVGEVDVTSVTMGDDSLSFDVSEVGVPVLVKVSYFPNWEVDGADGPWRISPNLMVVVPTDTHVELSYGREPVEVAGWGLTAAGVLGIVLLARSGPLPGGEMEGNRRRRRDVDPDRSAIDLDGRDAHPDRTDRPDLPV